MKLKDWLKKEGNGFSDRDLKFLIRDFFSKDINSVLTEDISIDQKFERRMNMVLQKYSCGMPMAYILGREDFFGLDFAINEHCLIPRPETELITERAIEIINLNNFDDILDLCCGCGNIAISIQKTIPRKLNITASDLSKPALEITKKNADTYKVYLRLAESDLFNEFENEQFDIIVTNPPYVPKQDIKGSLVYEPCLALEAGEDGLFFIRKIINNAHLHLKDKGFIVMEMGYNQKEAVAGCIKESGLYDIVDWIKDYSGRWRGDILKVKT
ncbi:MAG: peptide chain release factor N(5)-glutamine methyltransferase [Candidatus Omnitrophica bacterium]|nr:peptide chain release factor N(5)-glutamine methyltransferase [Candidatus Omnitrophota bacterium]